MALQLLAWLLDVGSRLDEITCTDASRALVKSKAHWLMTFQLSATLQYWDVQPNVITCAAANSNYLYEVAGFETDGVAAVGEDAGVRHPA